VVVLLGVFGYADKATDGAVEMKAKLTPENSQNIQE
jgi:hypothetical protein